MDTLITIAILIGAAILHALNKRRQQREESELPLPPAEAAPGEPGHAPRRPQPRTTNWEEELRRLLEGDDPASPPRPAAPPPFSPPVIVADSPRTVPPPLPPVIAGRPTPRPEPIPHAALDETEWEADEDMPASRSVPLAGFKQSAEAHLRASTLEARVAAQLEKAARQITLHQQAPQTRRVSQEISQALHLLRGRQSARTAFVLATVLGPPLGMER